MQLLERETALGDLTAALDETRAGAGAVALVSGEAGIGKTTLLRTFTADRPDGSRLLVGGCDDLSVPRPLGPLLEIADRVPFLSRRLQEDPMGGPRALLEELRREGPTLMPSVRAGADGEATGLVVSISQLLGPDAQDDG
jgi:predicted ATPase